MATTPYLLNIPAANIQLQLDQAVPFSQAAPDRATGAGGAGTVVTLNADPVRPNVISQIHCSYSAAPTGGALQIEDGSGNVVWKQSLGGTGPYEFNFVPARCGSVNTQTIITLAAPGGAVVGQLDVNCRKHL